MRVALLIALSLLWFPSEITAEIICGKAWVTLPGTVWSEHIHPADRRKQMVTVRKDDIDGMANFFWARDWTRPGSSLSRVRKGSMK